MAFALDAIVGSTEVSLTDGAPFRLISARGMGGASIRRVTAQGAAQHGDTDLGYRLSPREVELVIGFRADSDSQLDGHRDTLMSIFKPLPSTPVKLRVTRDDGEVRQLDCYTVGAVRIDLDTELRVGHYHRATVRLRAPEAAYYDTTQGSISVTGTALTASEWWLAGNAIGTAQVMEHGTMPTQGQVWAYSGTPAGTQGYTIVFRSAQESITDGKYAFFAGASGGSPAVSFSTSGTTRYVLSANYPDGGLNLGAVMAAGTHNYFVRWFVGRDGESDAQVYRDGGNPVSNIAVNTNYNLGGTARRWRSGSANSAASRWSNDLERYAVYVPALTISQMDALTVFMDFPLDETNAQNLAIPYAGDLLEYPTISITGPISDPAVTNLVTGHTLNFGSITIGAGTTYVINTHPQFKTVLSGTINKRGELSTDSDLGDFHLAPSPVAPGGTNTLFLSGTALGTATRFTVTYYNRYMSF